MKLLVLMGGTRNTDPSNEYPLFLTEINGKLIIETVLEKYLAYDFSEIIFCVKQEDIDSFNIDSIIKSIIPNAIIVKLRNKTAGAVCTALLAQEYIDFEEELLIVSIDDYIDCDICNVLNSFVKKDTDVGLVSFDSVHPRYSFIEKSDDGTIFQITEKKPVSKDALASFFYFKHGSDFVLAAQNEIRKDSRINGVFYISQAVNELILLQKKIVFLKISNDNFHSFKTERQLAAYITNYVKDAKIV